MMVKRVSIGNVRNKVVVLVLASVLMGCAGERAYREGVRLGEQGRSSAALEKLQQATQEAPDNVQYRLAWLRQRDLAATSLLMTADNNFTAGKLDEAAASYQQVLVIDPNQERAKTGLERIRRERTHSQMMQESRRLSEEGNEDGAAEKVQQVLLENPKQSDALALRENLLRLKTETKFLPPLLKGHQQLVSLEFRDAPVKMVFDALASASNINFILDRDLNPTQLVSIFVEQEPLDKTLDMLLKSNALAQKVIDKNTVVIYSKTPQKRQEYEEQLVKTFYLSNTDPKRIGELIKTILKTRDLYVDERLNMLVMRDTLEKIQMAEKLVALQDMPEPEVVLEVAVMEVTRGKLMDIGAQFPTQFGVLTAPAAAGAVATPLTVDVLKHLNGTNITASAPQLNIAEQISDINVLANPRIRVRNREKAKIHIGDRAPVITSTISTTGVASETVQYVDAGIKLEVEPSIFLEGDVAIKVGLEVSSLGTQTVTKNGSIVYRLSTRNATTLLRLKDGETQLLAGLVNDEERTTVNGFPLLAEIPLIGRIFSGHQDNRQKTEVVLSITPHIVRNIVLPDAKATQFWAGTESDDSGMGNAAEGVVIPPPPDPVTNVIPAPELKEAQGGPANDAAMTDPNNGSVGATLAPPSSSF